MAQPRRPPYDVVVVHHDNPEVYGVIDAVREQVPPPRQVVLVDNSGSVDPRRLAGPEQGVRLVRTGNDGYAAAVNVGVRELGAGGAPFLVVLTHEVRLTTSTLPSLVEALDSDARLAASGPVLYYRSAPERVFSGGGRLDRFGRPSHITAQPGSADAEPTPVDWIDGSVMALRRSSLEEVGLVDERYFLYFEEIDLALRLREAGGTTVVVPTAKAWQEPGGYPPYLAVRNRMLLLHQNPHVLKTSKALLYPRLLAEIVWAARRRGARTIPGSIRGLLHGARGVVGAPAR